MGASDSVRSELVPLWRESLSDYPIAVAISRSGQLCVIGTGDGKIHGFELETGRPRFERRAHAGSVLGVSIGVEGDIATCGQEPIAKLWRENGEPWREVSVESAAWVEHICWAPVGDRLAMAAGRVVRVYSGASELLFSSEPLASTVTGLAWRADGTGLAASSYGGVRLWPFVAHAAPRRLDWKGSMISLAWSPDGKVIAGATQDRAVHFWRLATGVDAEMSGYTAKPKAIAWDKDSKLLATAGDRAVTVWDFRGKGPEGTRPVQLSGHAAMCTSLAFSPRDGSLASGGEDGSVLLWDPRRSSRLKRHAWHEAEITALCWHPKRAELLATDAGGGVSYYSVS